jgi:hypothetical protein
MTSKLESVTKVPERGALMEWKKNGNRSMLGKSRQDVLLAGPIEPSCNLPDTEE